jgi:hypothetical protein
MRLTGRITLALLSGVLAASPLRSEFLPHGRLQEKTAKPDEPAEMQMIEGGFLAINTPKGWIRSEGPGLAFFVKDGSNATDAEVWIYVSGSPIGEGESSKNRAEYIQSDIAGFKERFKDGVVREEQALELPKTKSKVPVVSFESGQAHNAFEQVVYIEEQSRVLSLVLSAKNKEAFLNALPLFREFARSYGGSITLAMGTK